MTELEELKLAYEECSRQRNELLNKLKAQQEPVAWMDGYRNIYSLEEKAAGCEDAVIPLYTSPPASKPWVGLTEMDVGDFKGGYQSGRIGSFVSLVAAIEAKLKEKNT